MAQTTKEKAAHRPHRKRSRTAERAEARMRSDTRNYLFMLIGLESSFSGFILIKARRRQRLTNVFVLDVQLPAHHARSGGTRRIQFRLFAIIENSRVGSCRYLEISSWASCGAPRSSCRSAAATLEIANYLFGAGPKATCSSRLVHAATVLKPPSPSFSRQIVELFGLFDSG